jgi:hypothetical protein
VIALLLGALVATDAGAPEAALLEKLRALLPEHTVAPADHSIFVSWSRTELEPGAMGATETVVRRTLRIGLGPRADSHTFERQYRANEAALAELRQLQSEMERFSERHFASSRYSYEPRNAKERALVARCKKLLATLRPLPGYRLDEQTSVTLGGDMPEAEIVARITGLFAPLRATEASATEVVVYASFWSEEGARDPKECDPTADYSQSRRPPALPILALRSTYHHDHAHRTARTLDRRQR